jgi:hypothetical protein
MKNVKRLEIIINTLHRERVLKVLHNANITGYTLIDRAQGMGERGFQDGFGLTNTFTNVVFIVACTEQEAESLREPLRALLKHIGGVCLVSEAQWLLH